MRQRTIYNIDSVQRFRKLLTIGFTFPLAAGAVVFIINYITSAAKISSPIIPILFSILFFPPVFCTPYIVYVLFIEKRFGWLVTYFVIVLIPGIIAITVLGFEYGLIILILLAPFYFFCFIIKFSVEEWIREYNWNQQLIEQRKEHEEKKKVGLL